MQQENTAPAQDNSSNQIPMRWLQNTLFNFPSVIGVAFNNTNYTITVYHTHMPPTTCSHLTTLVLHHAPHWRILLID